VTTTAYPPLKQKRPDNETASVPKALTVKVRSYLREEFKEYVL